MPTVPKTVIALDVGSQRIGVAIASLEARLPRPLLTLTATDNDLQEQLQAIIEREAVGHIVVGLPRGMAGQQTAQTESTLQFAENLKNQLRIPIDMQDESVTSKQAEAELESRGKPYQRGDIDALAATYILEDWLAGHTEVIA